jgi:hypothetical protein
MDSAWLGMAKNVSERNRDLLLNFCVMCVCSQKSTTESKAIPRIGLDGFYPWDGLAIRGNNSSVAAKGFRSVVGDLFMIQQSIQQN